MQDTPVLFSTLYTQLFCQEAASLAAYPQFEFVGSLAVFFRASIFPVRISDLKDDYLRS